LQLHASTTEVRTNPKRTGIDNPAARPAPAAGAVGRKFGSRQPSQRSRQRRDGKNRGVQCNASSNAKTLLGPAGTAFGAIVARKAV